MFSRFWAWFSSFFTASPRDDIYHPKERMLFSYWNGEREVKADPIVLNKRVMSSWPDISIPIKVALSQSKDANKASVEAAAKVREVFHIKPLTNTYEVVNTLTDVEVFDLLNTFLAYCGGVKKNMRTSPTMSSPTEDSKPTSVENPPTITTSDSGSTATGSPTEKPVPSSLESPSPSV